MTVNTTCQQRAVIKVSPSGHISTNMQSTDFHSPAGQLYNSGLLVWRLHDITLSTVTFQFFVVAFIIISHVISHCICSMSHVLTCSSVLNVTHSRRLRVASGATAPGPALEGAPHFRPKDILMSLSSYILR
jgi:hypothetical protein